MDARSKDILARILLKDINDLTKHDMKFLKARKEYLTDAEKEIYFTKEKKEISYNELYKMAKAEGYVGKRIPRAELEKLLKIES